MSHEIHVPIEPQIVIRDEKLNESFSKWARSQVPFIITQVVSLLLACAMFIYYVKDSEEKISELISIQQAESLMYCLNLIFCIFCVIKLLSIYSDNSTGEFIARKIFKRVFQTDMTHGEHRKRRKQSMFLLKSFKLYFLMFWIVMVALYATFTVNSFIPNTYSENKDRELIRQESETVDYFLVKKDEQQKESIERTSTKNEEDYFQDSTMGDKLHHVDKNITIYMHPIDSWTKALTYKWEAMLTYCLNTISIMFILWCFIVIAIRAQKPTDFRRKPLLIYLSLFFTVILTALYPTCIGLLPRNFHNYYYQQSLINYSVCLDAISGVVNAVVFALFIARLDSKFIGLPSNLIGLLYLYSAVQPLFLVFDLPGLVNEAIKVSVLVTVFILKIYFFFIITYALQKGKIFIYLYCFGTVNDRVESIMKNEYAIKLREEDKVENGKYRYDIYLGEFIMFKGEIVCESRDECIKEIEKFRTISKRNENYTLKFFADAWYLQIVENNKTYCSSHIKIGSEKESKDIIDEAVEKIPFCEIYI